MLEISRLNEMLLQLFEEAILLDKNEPAFPLGPRFQSRNGYLEAADDQVFARAHVWLSADRRESCVRTRPTGAAAGAPTADIADGP